MKHRVLGILIIVVAIGIAVIPQSTKCPSSTMPCNYTAKAEMALSLPVLVEGLVLALYPRESHVGLSFVGLGLGISVILVAYALIGVCRSMGAPDCQTLMQPSLLLLGVMLILANASLLWISLRKKGQ
jgi:hypothetical protein